MKEKKIALITGGSRGLGEQMALSLADKGMDVIITYHNNKVAAQEVVAKIEHKCQNSKAFQLDTTGISGFTRFFEQVSDYLIDVHGAARFDFLINNAGTGIYKGFLETSESDFDAMMNIHIKGVYFLTQHAVPLLNEGGGIVNISSGLARFTLPGSSAYGSMKGAVEVFTKYLAKELGDRKIRANVVAPGAVATDFGGGENRDNVKKRSIIANNTALGRVGEPDDIGGVVAFLCTDEARWINGQRIEVAGGMML